MLAGLSRGYVAGANQGLLVSRELRGLKASRKPTYAFDFSQRGQVNVHLLKQKDS